ncbi:ATP-binding cassette domain-containing protein, partial [Lachnospiraceae bacterium OttesenSCG-928-D06]|nr:ATP-binding cassette domain-containing protein [Lachnospiraceae bacterium OttesenSCG-928-D06]
NYTGKQFLEYITVLKDVDEKRAREQIDKYIEIFSLEEEYYKPLKKLSGGMFRRVNIIAALLNDPQILILDEPSAGLDPKERVNFKNVLNELSQDRAVIVSTHITSDVDFIANKVCLMKDGQVLLHDNPVKLCKNLQDRVFETVVNRKEIKEFKAQYYVSLEQQEADCIKVRFILEPKQEQEENTEWVNVSPTLEDVYISAFKL